MLFAETDGDTVVEETARSFKGEQNRIDAGYQRPTFTIPEFNVAGVDFAVSLYRAIYPVAELVLA